MTDSSPRNKPHFLPVLQSRWWSLVLGFSLMINLLIAGAFIGVRLRDGPLMRQNNEARGQIFEEHRERLVERRAEAIAQLGEVLVMCVPVR